jgi:hypothetical protein
MTITFHEGDCGTFLLVAGSGRTRLVWLDWDFPSLAATFGWTPCTCGATDGTIDCDHRTVEEMITEAHEFLRAHAGDTADDPGYF